jgi:hypothetical protein
VTKVTKVIEQLNMSSYANIDSHSGADDPALMGALVCIECAGDGKFFERGPLCRYDCLRKEPEGECHCAHDTFWCDVKCDSDCGDDYGYLWCRCCKICKATETIPLKNETREELGITDDPEDEDRTGDSCSRCNRKVYHKFFGCLVDFDEDSSSSTDEDSGGSDEYQSIYLKVNEVCMDKLHRLVKARAGKRLKERKKTYFEKRRSNDYGYPYFYW